MLSLLLLIPILGSITVPFLGLSLKFKGPNWLKYLIMFILLILLYVFLIYLWNIFNITNLFNIIWFYVIFNLVLSLFIGYSGISILYLIKYYQMPIKDIKISKYLPETIKKHFLDLKESSKDKIELNVILNLHVKGILIAVVYLILFNLFMFFVCLITPFCFIIIIFVTFKSNLSLKPNNNRKGIVD